MPICDEFRQPALCVEQPVVVMEALVQLALVVVEEEVTTQQRHLPLRSREGTLPVVVFRWLLWEATFPTIAVFRSIQKGMTY